jgi:ABC-2 type transport system ATP-binding protein
MSAIEISNLCKTFGKVKALNNVDLSVNKGEIFGFIGPNGAGKSTTIRAMLSILKSDSGSIKIFDQDINDDSLSVHQRLAYVPGDVNLWPNLTGGQIIDLLLNLRNKDKSEYLEHLIKEFSLDITKKAKTYSKGNRQKVVLIAALACDVDLYIFDEPTSGLDPLMEKVFQKHVLELKKRGKTIFLSSHILSEVETLCDRIAIIKEGKIIETGTLSEMRHLTRMNIRLETDKIISGLDKLSGLYNVEQDDTKLSLQIDNDKFNELLDLLKDYKIINFISEPPTLEDLFLSYYGAKHDE